MHLGWNYLDMGLSYLWIPFYCVCGTGDWTQWHSTSKLHPQPYFIFILKQGLTRLMKSHYLRRLSSNLRSSCLSLPNTRIIGMWHLARLWELLFFVCGTGYWTQGHSTCKLHLQPNFIFYFETASKVAEGLAKLLRLATNLQSSCLSLPSTGITGVYHHAWLLSYILIDQGLSLFGIHIFGHLVPTMVFKTKYS